MSINDLAKQAAARMDAEEREKAGLPPQDGMMRINKNSKSETVKIQQFILENGGVMLNEIMIEVDFKSSTFAIAAMLKGLNEYYYKPAGMQGDGEALAQSEHNLKIWDDANQKAKSRIIMP